jgi:hypothetical protein
MVLAAYAPSAMDGLLLKAQLASFSNSTMQSMNSDFIDNAVMLENIREFFSC